jgi:hypothetical protein
VWRWLHIVSLSAIPGNAINADFDFRRISKMGLLQVLGADVEGREFGVRRCCAESALFHVFNFVIRYEMLGNAADSQGKSLRGDVSSGGKCMALMK